MQLWILAVWYVNCSDIRRLKINLGWFFHVALCPNAGQGLLILEVSRSHATTHHSR